MRKLLVLAAVGVGLASCSRAEPSPAPVSSSTTATATASTPTATAAAAATNDGTDSKSPVLAPDDATFVDARKGFGWGDRCFNEIKQGKWGWAHAACDRALALPDVDPKARPLVLYNEGLIAKHAGDNAAARDYFSQSLSLRSPTDPGRAQVEKDLASVGGTPPAPSKPVETFTGKDIIAQMSYASVKAEYTDLNFTTLYRADVNNDGRMEYVLVERNSVGLHNDWIVGVYEAAPSTGVMVGSKIAVPAEGPFKPTEITYFATPFLRSDPEGVTMIFNEVPGNKTVRYIWKAGHIRLLDHG